MSDSVTSAPTGEGDRDGERSRTAMEPPGPRGLPVVGSFLDYQRDPYGFLREMARTYGDVVHYEILGIDFYQVNHPEGIERVLVGNNQNYLKGELFQRSLGPVTGQGLLNAEGEQWRRQRHRIQPAFHPERIAGYADTMVARTEDLAGTWTDGRTRDVHEDMMRLTLEIVAEALFGVDVERDIDTVSESLEVVMNFSEGFLTTLIPFDLPTPARRRYETAIDDLEEVVYRIVDERQRNPGDDVVSWLLDAGEEGEGPSRELIRDEVMTLLLAGHETTALVLTFTWFLLAQHPDVERRLVDELHAELDGPPTMADLDDLPYLERVVKESMRLYPPVPSIIREPIEDDVIQGYRVPAGAAVSINQWTVHRDPRWYDDPMAFRPWRWTDDLEDDLPRLAYFPFSAGPRRCIGDRFAMLEAQLVLATLARDYHLELVSDPTLDLIPTITARPSNPVEMRIHERD
jgi:cytochrome P450